FKQMTAYDIETWLEFRRVLFRSVFAKGVTSGYLPLGGVVVSSRVADQFWNQEGNPFIHGTTYAGHPTCCAAAMANMDILEREDQIGRASCRERVNIPMCCVAMRR